MGFMHEPARKHLFLVRIARLHAAYYAREACSSRCQPFLAYWAKSQVLSLLKTLYTPKAPVRCKVRTSPKQRRPGSSGMHRLFQWSTLGLNFSELVQLSQGRFWFGIFFRLTLRYLLASRSRQPRADGPPAEPGESGLRV